MSNKDGNRISQTADFEKTGTDGCETTFYRKDWSGQPAKSKKQSPKKVEKQ